MLFVRLLLFVAGIVVGTFLLCGGGYVAYLVLRSPAAAYTDDFDTNLARSQPVLWPAIQADPILRKLVFDKTKAAYLRGGWPAASVVFYQIVHSRMQAFASDDATLACHQAWQDVFRALRPTPHACRLLQTGGTSALPPGLAASQIAHASSVCNAAAVDGARLHQYSGGPQPATDEEQRAIAATAMDKPNPLPDNERSARNGGGPADDALLCQAAIDFEDNIAALPASVAARYMRYSYAVEDRGDFIYVPPASPLAPGDPPAEFHCPATGTNFTLSMYGQNGRPITWRSLGQAGWDCVLQSSATGRRGLWTDLDDDSANELRLLWPVQLGKTANCRCEGENTSVLKVISNDQYWLPFGWVQAYAIENNISDPDGAPLYSITKYWSPALGFLIGQRTVVTKGPWPQEVAPDWQLVAIDPPAP
jgi:hypothetical protein